MDENVVGLDEQDTFCVLYAIVRRLDEIKEQEEVLAAEKKRLKRLEDAFEWQLYYEKKGNSRTKVKFQI